MSERTDWREQINWAIAPPSATHFLINHKGQGLWVRQTAPEITCFNEVGEIPHWSGISIQMDAGYFNETVFEYDWTKTVVDRPKDKPDQMPKQKPIERGDIVTVINNGCVGEVISASKKSVWVSFYGSNSYEFEWQDIRLAIKQEYENHKNASNLSLNRGDVVVYQHNGIMGEVLVSDKYEATVDMDGTHINFNKSEIRIANEEEKRDYYAKKGSNEPKQRPFDAFGKQYLTQQKIAYQKATINEALSNPTEEVVRSIGAALIRTDAIIDEMEANIKERKEFAKQIYVSMCANPNFLAVDSERDLIYNCGKLVNDFFEAFGYENG